MWVAGLGGIEEIDDSLGPVQGALMRVRADRGHFVIDLDAINPLPARSQAAGDLDVVVVVADNFVHAVNIVDYRMKSTYFFNYFRDARRSRRGSRVGR